jgi:three-Cys-motif partner protein
MNSGHTFGGGWTDTKVEFLKKYLEAYKTALKNQTFRTIYVDAFAGTGYRSITQDTEAAGQLAFDKPPVDEDEEETLFQIGSAQAALNIPSEGV